MTVTLKQKFDVAMLDIYRRAKAEAEYNATVFLNMLHERGGLGTAKFLINTANPSDGYTQLYLRGRLDLTVEAMIVDETQWHELFTVEEIESARKRLISYEYELGSR